VANIKITDLTAYTNPDSTDVLPIVDVGADVTKKVSVGEVIGKITGDVDVATDGTSSITAGAVLYNRRPALHRGPLFYKTAATTISIVAGAVLNGHLYSTATAVTMPGSFSNNVDYAIWQHPTTGALVADASFTSAPAGATGGSIVGGFHHIPSGRPTAVNGGSPTAAAEILEYSIWDLTWRPTCPDPRGMTCVDGRFWCDLYLCGSTSYAGSDFTAVPSSKIGLTIADENNPPLIPAIYGGDGTTAYSLVDSKEPGSWYDFAEVASSFGKRLISWLEFQHAAFGGPENGSRGSDPGTVIWERASLWGLRRSPLGRFGHGDLMCKATLEAAGQALQATVVMSINRVTAPSSWVATGTMDRIPVLVVLPGSTLPRLRTTASRRVLRPGTL